MAEKINNLGQYADLSAVWSRHPEGGREGDYVKIDGEEYLWDKYTRNWVAGGSSQGGDQGQTVGGDLNVNGDLNVAGDATIGGTLHVNNIQVGNAGRFKGQSSFTSFVFCRRATQPATPLNGTFDDPFPDGVLWHDSVPQGTESIWMSSRVFTSDGLSPQQTEWSTPRKLMDDETTAFLLSNWTVDSFPEYPNAENIGTLWIDPSAYSAQWSSMNWMAFATKSYDGSGNVVYGSWSIALIRGERGADGAGFENVFYRTKIFIAPTPVVASGSVFQADDYLPGVSSKATCEGEGNRFTDNPKGVDSTWKYEWMMTRKKKNGIWQNFVNSGLVNNPVLFATFSQEHDVHISDNGTWVIDGTDTGVRAAGEGVSPEGRVDYYEASDIPSGESGKTSLEGITTDATVEKTVGKCWIVDDSGYIYLYLGGESENWEDHWKELGEFKGEKGDDGVSTYMYLAWASSVTYTDDDPPEVDDVVSFTTDPGTGQAYGWLGILVSNTEIADLTAEKKNFKWNYLKGRDGSDFEHVYLRTKIYTAPTISEDPVSTPGFQDADHLPALDNTNNDFITSGSNKNVEYTTFTDDPKGVSEEWPYEWQSRRERINGVWGAFQSPAVLHRNWAEPGEDGNDGKDAVQIKTSKSVITVDANSDGEVASQLMLSLSCWLLVGGDITQILQSGGVTAKYGNDTLNSAGMPGQQGYILATESGHQARTRCDITIKLAANTALTNKDISVELTDGTNTARATVPVAIVRRGADGNGQRGADGSSLVPCGEWESGKTYYWNSVRRDYVTRNGSYYVVNTFTGDNGSTTLGTPGSSNGWLNVPAIPAIATELLLAENASIRLLSSNKLIFVDFNGHKTAGINEDGQGSYKTYYTESPYGVRKDDNADGWTYYYNNDAGNTLAWMLGPNGVIVRAGNVSMAAIKMSSDPISTPISYNPNLNVTVVDRYVYTGDNADYKDKVYMTGALNNNVPASAVVGDGTYSQTTSWIDRYDKDEDKYYHVLPLIRIFGGKITDRWEEKEEYQNPLNG